MDVEQLPDGSLLVSDDVGGTALRVSYSPPMPCRAPGSREDGEDSLALFGEFAATSPRGSCLLLPAVASAAAFGKLVAALPLRCCRTTDGETTAPLLQHALPKPPPPPAPPHLSLNPSVIPGTAAGCVVNLGSAGTPRFRRCVRADVSGGGGHWVQLASRLVVVNRQLVLRGALLVPRPDCVNPGGWVALGLPSSQGEDGMVGAQAFITRPAPAADTGLPRWLRRCRAAVPALTKPAGATTLPRPAQPHCQLLGQPG